MTQSTKLLAVIGALLVTPATGLAGCPTGDDLEEGIVLAQNEPFFMRSDFTATAKGFSEQRVIEAGGQVQESMALYQHGLVMVGEHSPAGHVEINYVDRLSPLTELPDLGTVSLTGVAKGPQGEAYVELEISFIEHGAVEMGDCRFETWSVSSSLKDRSGVGATFRMQYAPDLDLVLAASLVDEDGQETPSYAYQWAGTAADVRR